MITSDSKKKMKITKGFVNLNYHRNSANLSNPKDCKIHEVANEMQFEVEGRRAKVGKSKREMMEEMSRERFPWDE